MPASRRAPALSSKPPRKKKPPPRSKHGSKAKSTSYATLKTPPPDDLSLREPYSELHGSDKEDQSESQLVALLSLSERAESPCLPLYWVPESISVKTFLQAFDPVPYHILISMPLFVLEPPRMTTEPDSPPRPRWILFAGPIISILGAFGQLYIKASYRQHSMMAQLSGTWIWRYSSLVSAAWAIVGLGYLIESFVVALSAYTLGHVEVAIAAFTLLAVTAGFWVYGTVATYNAVHSNEQ
ncbi:hypothetical protein SISNIDRAFT_486269 [Sistotremastrum niveocremeum HHB9708]|uniref:Uncharacterized protein n=1 Tax=Sistotremastrum niveocremeum HHB9708 TaxID=1314777 RepID=A0A164TZ71_9AGAM|nr:hypothetical protein SISNIDRAFT_486269 [Sistotremastrum niveocremeum HHB9708]